MTRVVVSEVVVGEDTEATGGVEVGGVGVHGGEVIGEAVVGEDGGDEEGVGVAEDAELAAARVQGLDRSGNVRGQRSRTEGGSDVVCRLPLRVKLAHHGVLCE